MTAQASDRGGNIDGAPLLQVILATHSREVQTALFHSLNAIATVTIVATGTSTAELVNYSHAFRPDIVIVEAGLPGLPLSEVLMELGTMRPLPRVLLIGEDAEMKTSPSLSTIDVFTDLDLLIAAIPNKGADAQ
jgi:chemotaxis response regulator CheB